MMIRKYIVKDIPEAVVMIRKELGKDAVILNTRKVWAKRWGGLWRSKRVEVVAATGDDVPRRAVAGDLPDSLRQAGTATRVPSSGRGYQPPSERSVQSARDTGMGTTTATAEREVAATGSRSSNSAALSGNEEVRRLWAELSELKQRLGTDDLPEEGETESQQAPRSAPQQGEQSRTYEAPVWSRQENTPRYEAPVASQPDAAANDRRPLQPQAIAVEARTSPAGEEGLNRAAQALSRLRQHLLLQGVSPDNVEKLMQQCDLSASQDVGSGAQNPANFESLRQVFIDAANRQMGGLAEPKPLGQDSRVIGMVGPTGVGKTTTIAKLAALHVLEGKRKVGLLTTDTFRIAAVDQLRTYANILNIPLQVVYQESDIDAALSALVDRDLILVDTAGRNFANTKHVDETYHLLETLGCDEVHLVLSLTSKSDDLGELANAFMDLPVTQVILTKLDETRSYGGALNLLLDFKRPLSYLTMGQNVPDDIAVASTEKLLRLTAGGARF